ncbi:pentatricopeptide repeat-containing protein [Babesia caballi]|uniref:Pentatricopeptide repeat-containing protein n=1 Tax=Babesia caballi TaxID=5871 RepID=A0AAV4LTE6_BABCB|nr:pentatricopeptide repeat-containing protein [Babesia caballi]
MLACFIDRDRAGTLKCLHSAVLDGHLRAGGAAGRALQLHLLQHGPAVHQAPEDDVPAVEPRRLHRCDEELAAVAVGTRVGHRKGAGAAVAQDEALVLELVAVDADGASAVAPDDVATLTRRDDTVKNGALVAVRTPVDLVTFAQAHEVLHGLGRLVGVETQDELAQELAILRNVQSDAMREGGLADSGGRSEVGKNRDNTDEIFHLERLLI